MEVDKTTGNVAVKRFTLSHDCGLIINPDGLKNQIEGNIIQGVSRALMEEVKFDSSGIKTLDWASYPVIRFPNVPEIEIVLINRPEMPALGGGEPSSAPIAAAIANAIFDATGAAAARRTVHAGAGAGGNEESVIRWGTGYFFAC